MLGRYTTFMDRGLAHPSDQGLLFLLLMIVFVGCWCGSAVLPVEVALTFNLDVAGTAFSKIDLLM